MAIGKAFFHEWKKSSDRCLQVLSFVTCDAIMSPKSTQMLNAVLRFTDIYCAAQTTKH